MWPVPAAYHPPGHSTQWSCVALGWKRPAAQGVHVSVVAFACFPAMHARHRPAVAPPQLLRS